VGAADTEVTKASLNLALGPFATLQRVPTASPVLAPGFVQSAGELPRGADRAGTVCVRIPARLELARGDGSRQRVRKQEESRQGSAGFQRQSRWSSKLQMLRDSLLAVCVCTRFDF